MVMRSQPRLSSGMQSSVAIIVTSRIQIKNRLRDRSHNPGYLLEIMPGRSCNRSLIWIRDRDNCLPKSHNTGVVGMHCDDQARSSHNLAGPAPIGGATWLSLTQNPQREREGALTLSRLPGSPPSMSTLETLSPSIPWPLPSPKVNALSFS